MAKHHRHRLGLARTWIRSSDIDEEYNLPGNIPTPPAPPPPPPRNTWVAGRLVQPNEIYEPLLDNGFQYKAIQASAAYTGATEPNWPIIAGNTVVDGGVTWQAIAKTSITWTAVPLYKSGATEPVWPITPTVTVTDNTIVWTTTPQYIADQYNPHSKSAIIMANKVFKPSVRGDVVRFSATNDPTDWTSAEDAGFLSTGLQAQADPVTRSLGQYRGNLVAWSAAEFQVWQVDPDPARNALIDTIPSIGTIYRRAHASVAGDLYFLTPLGIRSVSIAGGSTNLQAGDVGTPIDTLVQPFLTDSADPVGVFYPSGGQYWVSFSGQTWVYSQSRIGGIGAWSLYEWPAFDYVAQQGGKLYLRIGDEIWLVDETTGLDNGVSVAATVQWPWLDFGQSGVQKRLIGLDVVGSGSSPTVEIGYDETNQAAFTPAYAIPADTQPGKLIPFPASAPSFSMRLRYQSQVTRWELQAASLWFNDNRPTS